MLLEYKSIEFISLKPIYFPNSYFKRNKLLIVEQRKNVYKAVGVKAYLFLVSQSYNNY